MSEESDKGTEQERDGATEAGGEQREPQDGVIRIVPPSGGDHAEHLLESCRAFNRGDNREARRLARLTLESSPPCSTEEAAFADEILSRTAIDPVAMLVGLGSFGLFWLLIYIYVWR
jgi:hypothetical protein